MQIPKLKQVISKRLRADFAMSPQVSLGCQAFRKSFGG